MAVLWNLRISLTGDTISAALFMQMVVHIHPWVRKLSDIGGKNKGYGFCALGTDELSYKKILKTFFKFANVSLKEMLYRDGWGQYARDSPSILYNP